MENYSAAELAAIRASFLEISPDLRRMALGRGHRVAMVFQDNVTVDGRSLRLNGQTGFYRYSSLMRNVIHALSLTRPHDGETFRVLAAPSSVGCEAYSFAALAQQEGLKADIAVRGVDLSARFTKLARGGIYPEEAGQHLGRLIRRVLFDPAFDAQGTGTLRIHPDIASKVRFLDPQGIENFRSDAPYDVVMMNNLFKYMTPEQMAGTIDVIDQSCAQFMIFMGDDKGRHIANGMAGLTRFIPVEEHPQWARTALARYIGNIKGAHGWAAAPL